jgi:hypothetical protein
MNKKRTYLKSIIWSFSILILLIILFFSFPYLSSVFFGEDETILNDSDLILSEVNISESENSYFDLIKLSSILDNNEVKEAEIKIEIPQNIEDLNYLESYNWDKEVIEELLENNKEALQILSEAAGKTQFQFGITANPENIKPNMAIVNFNPWIQISKINAIKAIHLMKEEKIETAFDEAIKIIKIGDDIEKSRNLHLLPYMVGIEIKKIGLETIQILYENSLPSVEILENTKEKLEQYKSINNTDPLKAEYMNFKKSIEIPVKERISYLDLNNNIKELSKHKYYYKQIKTLNIAAEYYHQMIEIFNKSCDDSLSIITNKTEITWKIYFTENAIGKILVNSIESDLSNILEKKCDNNELMDSILELFTLRK